MRKTVGNKDKMKNGITVSTETLTELLDCGRVTAKKIGEAAGAKIQIGRRVLWNTEKIRAYLATPDLNIYS